VRAAFIWNERQFLLDQAVLSDARAAPTMSPMPIDRDIFWRFVEDYDKAVVIAPFRKIETTTQKTTAAAISKRLKESQAAALLEISQQLPADVIWLLRNTGLGSDPPTSPGSTMDELIKQRAETYIKLTKALLNPQFTPTQSETNYHTILDLKDVFNIDRYRINQLY
jgi:hypothetical protein